ncbi:MAG: ABC transporter permease [Phycisphaerae bacterium]|nr:ABC transporter permease [Phycisphaerae bacterium]
MPPASGQSVPPAAVPVPAGVLSVCWRVIRRSRAGTCGAVVLVAMLAVCLGSLPWTLGRYVTSGPDGRPYTGVRYDRQDSRAARLPPAWWPHSEVQAQRRAELGADASLRLMGTESLGRDLFTRVLLGGAISLTIGLAAACISVVLGTLYGALAGWVGGRTDALMMRFVDVLYGLPYILLVVLLAVAVDAVLDRWQSQRGLSEQQVQVVGIATLLVAIGGVSWLTMARVVRGQVLSLKQRPFIEAARAVGVGPVRLFARHLLPNLAGPIVVYATLTVPQAILQESFLSFLGIGVKPPLPSWGNLAADGLGELNTVQSRWWLLFFPCLLLGATLLALNFVGEALREAMDPRRAGDSGGRA